MAKQKSPILFVVRILSLAIGISFPFVHTPWKLVILVVFFVFRVIDIDKENKLLGATSLFFIGMILGFISRLF